MYAEKGSFDFTPIEHAIKIVHESKKMINISSLTKNKQEFDSQTYSYFTQQIKRYRTFCC